MRPTVVMTSLTALLAISLQAQVQPRQEGRPALSDTLQLGQVSNGVYTNQYFGIRLPLPEGWVVLNDDEAGGFGDVMGEIKRGTPLSSLPHFPLLRMVNLGPQPVGTRDTAAFVIGAESLGKGSSGSLAMAAWAERQRRESEAAVQGQRLVLEQEVIGGRAFRRLDSAFARTTQVRQRQWFAESREYALVCAGRYANALQLAQIQTVMQGLELTTPAQAPVLVATVEGRPITAEAFRHVYQQTLQAYRSASGDNVDEKTLQGLRLDLSVLQRLINEEAVLADAHRLNIGASREEIRKTIQSLPAFQESGHFIGDQRYRQMLQDQKPPLREDEFEDQVGRQMIVDKLRARATSGAAPKDNARQTALYETYVKTVVANSRVTIDRDVYAQVVASSLAAASAAPATASAARPRAAPAAAFVQLEQDGRRIPIENNQVSLGRAPFTLVITLRRTNATVMVYPSFSATAYDLALAGRPTDAIFPSGGGMAEEDLNVSKSLFIPAIGAFHYWHYQDERRHRFDAVVVNADTIVGRRTVAMVEVPRAAPRKIADTREPALYLVFKTYAVEGAGPQQQALKINFSGSR